MSDDDLFWPPLGEESPSAATDGEASSEHPTEPLADGAAESHPTQPLPQQRDRRRWTTAAIVGVTAFVFGAGGVAIGAALNNGNSSSDSSSGLTSSTADPAALSTDPKSFAAIASKVLPSVVSISVTTSSGGDTGSGIVLQPDGYILTNNHVVTDATNGGGSVSVTFNDGSTISARIVGTDALDDLAVIKVDKTGLTPAALGNSAQVQVGDPVLAVGSPLGLSGTVTQGIISALRRPVETQQEQQQQQQNPFGGLFGNGGGSTSQTTAQPTVIQALQTDAAINPGNSGGALVAATGQVIGINSAIASLSSSQLSGSQSGSIGVGFAIPINQAKIIAGELIKSGKATHPLLGVSLGDQTSSDGVVKAVVKTVSANGPAAKAGLKVGDVITAINNQPTAGTDAVIAAERTYQPGNRISLTYLRGGSTKTVSLVLATDNVTQN
jgi:putative serine protease PepD